MFMCRLEFHQLLRRPSAQLGCCHRGKSNADYYRPVSCISGGHIPVQIFLFCSARWAGSGFAWRSRSLLLGLVEQFFAHTGGGIAVFYVIFQWSRRRSGLHRNDPGREADAPQDGPGASAQHRQ
jgi:hypothetical protein